MASKSADEIDLSMSSTPQNKEQQQQKQQRLEASYRSETSSRSLAPMVANTPGGHKAGGGAFPYGGMSPLCLSATEGVGVVGGVAGTSSMLRQSAYGAASASYDATSITLGIDERNAAASMSLLRGDGSLDHLLQSTPRKKPPTDQQRMTQQQHPLFMSSPSPGMKFIQYMTHGSELKSSAAQLELEAARRSSGKRKDPLSSELRYGLNPSARSFVPLSLPQESTALKEFPFIFDGYSGWVCRHCSHLDHYHRGPNYSMKGEKPPPNDFVDKHLRFCPALNQRLSFDLGSMMAQGDQYGQIHMQHSREGEEKEVEYATPEEEQKPPRNRKDTSTWMSPTRGLGNMKPQAQAAATAAFPSMYPQFSSQMTMSTGMSPHSKGPNYLSHMMQQRSPPRKRVAKRNIFPGHEITNKAYDKALSLLQKRADNMPRPSSSDDVGSTLVKEEDTTLVTDYFYYVALQLTVCRFTEEDTKTRGGKRKDVQLGYGGLQCSHCASTPSARKFFWSNVDRLANSFAEIPAHVLKCKTCPPEVTEALLALKVRHTEQMALLPRGSQKVFLRRMWRRLHDGDADAAQKADTSVHKALGETSQRVTSGTAAKVLKNDNAVTPPQAPRDPVLLAVPQDKDWLSDLDCFVRKQVEVFTASKTDVEDAEEDQKYLIQLGQVGIRCLHCAKLGGGARGDAVTYPCAISGIYESVRELQRCHFDECSSLPQELKSERSKITSSVSSLSSVLRRYYVQASKALGLYDSLDGGIRAGGKITPPTQTGFSGPAVAGKQATSLMDSEDQDEEEKPAKKKKARR